MTSTTGGWAERLGKTSLPALLVLCFAHAPELRAGGLDCAGAMTINCDEAASLDTNAGSELVSDYGCSPTSYDGKEVLFAFTNPVTQPINFSLDDSASPAIDLFLLVGCDPSACSLMADSELRLLLPPGDYILAVDSPAGAEDAFDLTITCPNSMEPGLVSFSGEPGSACIDEHKSIFFAPLIPRADVLITIDLTGSMAEERANLLTNIGEITARLEEEIPDLAFGLVSYKDYIFNGTVNVPCTYTNTHGSGTDYPYRLEQPITTDRMTIADATAALPIASGGRDGPESYSRVFHEAVHDLAIGWREHARRIIINFGDQLPHDCNTSECLGEVVASTGIDLGRDGLPETDDDLAILDTIQGLVDNGITLIHMHSGPSTMLPAWDCWAESTGGDAFQLNTNGTVPGGVDLVEYLGDVINETSGFCADVHLEVEPGFEEWLTDAGTVIFDQTLPASLEFDIQICIPPGTPAGIYQFEVLAFCSSGIMIGQRIVAEVGTCSYTEVFPPTGDRICAGETATLDASGLVVENCFGGEAMYEWVDGEGMPVAMTPTVDVMPTATTDYTVTATCSTNPTCTDMRTVTVEVDDFSTWANPPAIEDPSVCDAGLVLSWEEAAFPDGDIPVYNVYRSEVSCEDALTRFPVSVGLRDLSYVDTDTVDGTTYYYVVEAEGSSGSTCFPRGPRGGSATRHCFEPLMEIASIPWPAGVDDTLRVNHVGEEVTVRWDTARPLETGEEFHLLKTSIHPTLLWTRVNPVDDVSLSYTETDTRDSIQFFDLRVEDLCGQVSEDEYPATIP
ncbi:MAG: hypothetical protein AAF533_28840 [Acidobacteriota bacterium]